MGGSSGVRELIGSFEANFRECFGALRCNLNGNEEQW